MALADDDADPEKKRVVHQSKRQLRIFLEVWITVREGNWTWKVEPLPTVNSWCSR